MPHVLISDNLSQTAIPVFTENNIRVDFLPLIGKTPTELEKIIQKYDGIVVRSNTKITASLLDKATKLKVIGRAGVGVDNIDIMAASSKGIVVMNTPFGNSITTAEHTIAMILSLARQIPQANYSTKSGKWEKTKFVGQEITGKVLGLIGVGNIGSIVASRAVGLSMRVFAYDPYLSDDQAKKIGVIKTESLQELLKNSDFVSLHLPLTKNTVNFISSSELTIMKPGARLVNCARGGLVDEAAVFNAISSGHLSGAAFDVFQEEPAVKNPLFSLDNVICTPHLGASTKEAQENVAFQISQQICSYLRSGSISNALNAPSITPEEAPLLRPWVALVEVLGSFAGQVTETAIEEVEIEFVGSVREFNLNPLVCVLIAAILRPIIGKDSVNMVSAPIIARERGVKISEVRKDAQGAFGSYVRLLVTTKQQTRSIAGTIYSDGKPRFIQIKGINLEAEPQPFMIYATNQDSPGFIGSLGTELGNLGINIATFALGRSSKNGEAIALLGVDEPISKSDIEKIRRLPKVINAHSLVF